MLKVISAELNRSAATQNPSLFYFVLFAPQIHPEIKTTLFALRCWQSLTLAIQVVNFEQKETFLPFSSLVKFSQVLLQCIIMLSCMGWSRLQNWFFKKYLLTFCLPFQRYLQTLHNLWQFDASAWKVGTFYIFQQLLERFPINTVTGHKLAAPWDGLTLRHFGWKQFLD